MVLGKTEVKRCPAGSMSTSAKPAFSRWLTRFAKMLHGMGTPNCQKSAGSGQLSYFGRLLVYSLACISKWACSRWFITSNFKAICLSICQFAFVLRYLFCQQRWIVMSRGGLLEGKCTPKCALDLILHTLHPLMYGFIVQQLGITPCCSTCNTASKGTLIDISNQFSVLCKRFVYCNS